MTARTFRRVMPRPADAGAGATGPSGVRCDVYEGDWNALPEFDALEPVRTETVAGMSLRPEDRAEYVGRRYTAFLSIPRDDVYTFALISDDGSRLRIGEEVVIDNDGLHGTHEERGVIALAAGLHRVTVEWFNKTGGAALELRVAGSGEDPSRIAEARWSRER